MPKFFFYSFMHEISKAEHARGSLVVGLGCGPRGQTQTRSPWTMQNLFKKLLSLNTNPKGSKVCSEPQGTQASNCQDLYCPSWSHE